MKTVRIDFSSFDHSQQQLNTAYEIIRSVFKSLPPLELLKQFPQDDGASYYQWYNQTFIEAEDMPRGAELILGDDYYAIDSWTCSMTLVTPISQRRIFLLFDKATMDIVDLAIAFPCGSIHAASRIWHELFYGTLLPSAFVVELGIEPPDGRRVRAMPGDAVRFLWPLHLSPDDGYLGTGLDTEYCLSSLSIDGARRDEYPDEYGKRLLSGIS